MNHWEIAALAALSVLGWFAGMYLMSKLGGWAKLATKFRTEELADGDIHRFCSGSVGMSNYGGCFTIRVMDSGLHISASLFGLPILLWHPPILIPWSEFHSTTKKSFLFWSSTTTYVGMPVVAHMTLPGWVAEYILSEERAASNDV